MTRERMNKVDALLFNQVLFTMCDVGRSSVRGLYQEVVLL